MANHGRKKVIIDCDPGTDDAMAMLMLLSQPHIELVAVTTVMGNSDLENTSFNALRTLKLANRLDVPVYKGSDLSLAGYPFVGGNYYHGNDGFGDVLDDDPPRMDMLQEKNAASAMVEIINAFRGEVTLLVIGPLTNIAVALHLDHQLGAKLADFVIMGGNTTAKGNITPCGEFNFVSDPEAARMVLDTLGRQATIIPMELCENYSFPWDWHGQITSMSTKNAQFLAKIMNKIALRERQDNAPFYFAYDPLGAACVIDSNVATETEKVYATVELAGCLTRGQMVIDWLDRLKKPHNVKLVTKVNRDLYFKYVTDAMRN